MMKETNLFAHVWQMCVFTETMKTSIDVGAKQSKIYKERMRKRFHHIGVSKFADNCLWFFMEQIRKAIDCDTPIGAFLFFHLLAQILALAHKYITYLSVYYFILFHSILFMKELNSIRFMPSMTLMNII